MELGRKPRRSTQENQEPNIEEDTTLLLSAR